MIIWSPFSQFIDISSNSSIEDVNIQMVYEKFFREKVVFPKNLLRMAVPASALESLPLKLYITAVREDYGK